MNDFGLDLVVIGSGRTASIAGAVVTPYLVVFPALRRRSDILLAAGGR
jgi:hypothetical protein